MAITKEQYEKQQAKRKVRIQRRKNTSLAAMAQDLHSLQSRRVQ